MGWCRRSLDRAKPTTGKLPSFSAIVSKLEKGPVVPEVYSIQGAKTRRNERLAFVLKNLLTVWKQVVEAG